jgi:hypothetical protein
MKHERTQDLIFPRFAASRAARRSLPTFAAAVSQKGATTKAVANPSPDPNRAVRSIFFVIGNLLEVNPGRTRNHDAQRDQKRDTRDLQRKFEMVHQLFFMSLGTMGHG